MNHYTETDRLVWKTLFERQSENLKTKGNSNYNTCLVNMKPVLHADEIPNFKQINKWFELQTGWQIEVVTGLIPVEEFFGLLAQKKFCSSTWLRSLAQLDYLEEPDMFHDIFGHIPLLSNPEFSAFAHEFGKIGQANQGNEKLMIQLQRLYWFTIEFGLIRENKQIKAYGAGIISSFGETNRVAKLNCHIFPFDLQEVFSKFFRTDVMQEDYFLIESFTELTKALEMVFRPNLV